MLTHGEDVEAHALRQRGWTISAIARHLGRDRKTVRGYISGERVPGVRARSAPDPLEPFTKYLTRGSATTRTCGPRPSMTRSSGSATR